MTKEITQEVVMQWLLSSYPNIQRGRWRTRVVAELCGADADPDEADNLRESIMGLRYEPDAFVIEKELKELLFSPAHRPAVVGSAGGKVRRDPDGDRLGSNQDGRAGVGSGDEAGKQGTSGIVHGRGERSQRVVFQAVRGTADNRPDVPRHAGQRLDVAIPAHGRDDACQDQQTQGFTHPDGHVLPRDCRANIRAAIRPTNGLKARCAEGAV